MKAQEIFQLNNNDILIFVRIRFGLDLKLKSCNKTKVDSKGVLEAILPNFKIPYSLNEFYKTAKNYFGTSEAYCASLHKCIQYIPIKNHIFRFLITHKILSQILIIINYINMQIQRQRIVEYIIWTIRWKINLHKKRTLNLNKS